MNDIRHRKRDGSVDNPRESEKGQNYFDQIDESVYSEAGDEYHRKSERRKTFGSKG